jgi:Cd2+/Zn2+-exporting ATPase
MGKKEIRLLIPVLIIIFGWSSRLLGNMLVFNASMLIASIILGYDVARSALLSLKYRVISINLLVFIAALGGIYLREYWEAAAVTFLFVFGSYLEAKALGRTRNALAALIQVIPMKANLLSNGEIKIVEIEEIKTGDIVVVKPGEKIPVDGKIINGQAAVDEATITGESIPRLKNTGDNVFSTTINVEGYLEIETKKVGEDTLFSKIIYLVEKAQEKKADTQRFIESFSKYYTPGVIALSLFTYLFTRDLRLSITFLVIACPGALVISTPVSIVSAIGNGAKNGVIVKGGSSLEKAGRIGIVAFDKTGTLTKGKPKVYTVKGFDADDRQVLSIAASAELYSEHPLAKAIIDRAAMDNARILKPDDFEVIIGRGVKARLDGQSYLVGSEGLIMDNGVEIPESIKEYVYHEQEKGSTVVLVAGSRVLGALSIRDENKDQSAKVIEYFRKLGIKTYMLTGDNERVAKAVAGELGLDGYYAELLPDHKLRIIDELKKKGRVAMVGDGINDAPALAEANIGIAVSGATDITMETADMVIMSDNLEKITHAIGLARSTLKNLRINIGFSIFVVVSLLLGVVKGSIFLASGMFFHELSVILVILNGMRLMGYRSDIQHKGTKK